MTKNPLDRDSDNDSRHSSHKQKNIDRQMMALKTELGQMLSEPLISRGVSARYITSGSRPIVDDLLAGDRELLFWSDMNRV